MSTSVGDESAGCSYHCWPKWIWTSVFESMYGHAFLLRIVLAGSMMVFEGEGGLYTYTHCSGQTGFALCLNADECPTTCELNVQFILYYTCISALMLAIYHASTRREESVGYKIPIGQSDYICRG